MKTYEYIWQLQPESDLHLEVQVSAPSVLIARKRILNFLAEHDGAEWQIQSVSRTTQVAASGELGDPEATRSPRAETFVFAT